MFPKYINTVISSILIAVFSLTSFYVPKAEAGEIVVPLMPKPGTMVDLSPAFMPSLLKGIVIHPDNALKFDFIVHKGDGNLSDEQKKIEYNKLIKYFLASLAVPDKNQWVNLSPYEKNHIIDNDFGKTEMGRDLLAQDYLLKQITSSLIYPEKGLGKKFWDEVYAKAFKEYGNTNIPVNTFNKVWIMPDKAVIYEKDNTAYVLENHLKVMLEEDYLSLNKNSVNTNSTHSVASKVIRQVILPAIEKEVNEGKNFAMLRQVYSSMLLAAWYKRALKESLLGKVYADKNRVVGIDQNPKNNEAIYERYLQAFKKGVFDYVKEEPDAVTQQMIPRKYFSGGTTHYDYDRAVTVKKAITGTDSAMLVHGVAKSDLVSTVLDELRAVPQSDVAINAAMTVNMANTLLMIRGQLLLMITEDREEHLTDDYETLMHELSEVGKRGELLAGYLSWYWKNFQDNEQGRFGEGAAGTTMFKLLGEMEQSIPDPQQFSTEEEEDIIQKIDQVEKNSRQYLTRVAAVEMNIENMFNGLGNHVPIGEVPLNFRVWTSAGSVSREQAVSEIESGRAQLYMATMDMEYNGSQIFLLIRNNGEAPDAAMQTKDFSAVDLGTEQGRRYIDRELQSLKQDLDDRSSFVFVKAYLDGLKQIKERAGFPKQDFERLLNYFWYKRIEVETSAIWIGDFIVARQILNEAEKNTDDMGTETMALLESRRKDFWQEVLDYVRHDIRLGNIASARSRVNASYKYNDRGTFGVQFDELKSFLKGKRTRVASAKKTFNNWGEIGGVFLFDWRWKDGKRRYIFLGNTGDNELSKFSLIPEVPDRMLPEPFVYRGRDGNIQLNERIKASLRYLDFLEARAYFRGDDGRIHEDQLNELERKTVDSLRDIFFVGNSSLHPKNFWISYHVNNGKRFFMAAGQELRFFMEHNFDKLQTFLAGDPDLLHTLNYVPFDQDIYFGRTLLPNFQDQRFILREGKVVIESTNDNLRLELFRQGDDIFIQYEGQEAIKVDLKRGHKILLPVLKGPPHGGTYRSLRLRSSGENKFYISIYHESYYPAFLYPVTLTYEKPNSTMVTNPTSGIDLNAAMKADSAEKEDKAQVSKTPGGIDLNSANLNMTIQRDGKGVPLPLAQQDMAQLSRIQGFVPRIIEIRPAAALPIFSDLRQRTGPASSYRKSVTGQPERF